MFIKICFKSEFFSGFGLPIAPYFVLSSTFFAVVVFLGAAFFAAVFGAAAFLAAGFFAAPFWGAAFLGAALASGFLVSFCFTAAFGASVTFASAVASFSAGFASLATGFLASPSGSAFLRAVTPLALMLSILMAV